jgi:hypothetical protein
MFINGSGPSAKEEVTMSHAEKKRRVWGLMGPALAAVLATWLVLQIAGANVILKAAGINPANKGKWSAITDVATQLQAPLLVTMVAAVPLGILGGGILMAIGHRHAAKMLGQVVAGVVVVGIGTTLAN